MYSPEERESDEGLLVGEEAVALVRGTIDSPWVNLARPGLEWRVRRTGSEKLAKALWVRSLARERMLLAPEERWEPMRGRELVETDEVW